MLVICSKRSERHWNRAAGSRGCAMAMNTGRSRSIWPRPSPRRSCSNEHLLVEAGTGVGKTVGYLTPAIIYAADGKPVVISTHTINLQGQLVTKDIPMMRQVMEDHPFQAVLMKGRGNFLCLQELDHASIVADLPGRSGVRAASAVGVRNQDRRRQRARLPFPRLVRRVLQPGHLQARRVPL